MTEKIEWPQTDKDKLKFQISFKIKKRKKKKLLYNEMFFMLSLNII